MPPDEQEGRDAPTADYNPSNFSELGGADSAERIERADPRDGDPPISDFVEGDSEGTYELIERVGEGAYGVVWRAWDRKLKRHVALKFLRAGMDTRESLSRFRQEQEILAQLKHPNLATVFDSGVSPTGRPFFAMEFVQGSTLTSFCDREKLDLRRRLELFVLVCDAVQFAHSNNIAHRDLKPANILVEFGPDREPRPVVIDFGVARSMGARLAGRDHDTQSCLPVGTLEYMSPEQVLPRGTAVDNLSDVYALGVILYELLAGFAPFDFSKLRKEDRLDEIQRIVIDVDPPTPRARLSTIAIINADLGEKIARARRAQLSALEGALADELQWIPLKAIKKDRVERYQTASALAEDVRRYLEGLPIHAAPDSRLYRSRKFIRRNRAGIVIFSAVALGLGAGAVGHVRGELAAGELEVRRKQEEVDAARERELESRKNLLELQRASLISILKPLLREEVGDAVDAQSTRRVIAARASAAEAWMRFCERPDPELADGESVRELVSDLRMLGETAMQAARWAQSARVNATGGGDPAARARWIGVAEAAKARILRIAPNSPEAENLATRLGRSEVDTMYRAGRFDEVIATGNLILGTAVQVLSRQTDPEQRAQLESEFGRLRGTVADSLSKRGGAMLAQLAAIQADEAHAADVADLSRAIEADRRQELELRQFEVERRRRLCDDHSVASPQTRHDLMIAIERLSLWYAASISQGLSGDLVAADIAREREIGLDAEYRERYLATSPSERSDLERSEFASWSVREADAAVSSVEKDTEQHRQLLRALERAIDDEVGTCIELMWRNSGDARVHERLVKLQTQYLGAWSPLDAVWRDRCTMRIADLVVIPAEAARAEERMPPGIAHSIRLLRLGSAARRARIIATADPEEATRLAESAVVEARALLADARREDGASRNRWRGFDKLEEFEICLALEVGRERSVRFVAELDAELTDHSAKPR